MQPGVGLRWSRARGGATIVPGPRLEEPGLAHPDVPFTTRPDFLVPELRTVLEVKAPRELEAEEWGPDGTAEAPPWYVVQVLAQLAIVRRHGDYERAELFARARAARRGERVQASYVFVLDEVREARLIRKVREWVERHVVDGVPPPPDGSPSATSTLTRIFRPTDTILEANDDDIRVWHTLLQNRTARDEIEARIREDEQTLMARMKGATVLARNGKRFVTWRARARATRIDIPRLRREAPDVAEKFTVAGEAGRTFRIEHPEEP